MSRYFGGTNPVRQGDRARLLLVVAAGAGLLAFSLVAFLFLNSGPTTASTTNVTVVEKQMPVEMASVLVPVQKIDPGVLLEPTMFRRENRPRMGLSEKVVRDFEEIKGMYSRSLIASDQPLHRDYLTEIRPTNVITAHIPEGYRAVTINVNERSSVEGWARPGARVDVVWASKIRGQEAVTVIVQNARILSAQRQTDTSLSPVAGSNNKDVGVPSTVTLLVTAKDAAKIQLASTTGSLSLSLRGDNDAGKGTGNGGSITIDDLLGIQKQQESKDDDVEGSVKMRLPNGELQELVVKRGGQIVHKGE